MSGSGPVAGTRPAVSAVVTTLDNARTLDACLASVAWCEERIVLDSGSTDATLAIAAQHQARVASQPFAGYGAQKQAAIALAHHDWVLLLDADEELTEAGRHAIEQELAAPRADGYRLPRHELLFWRWPHPATRPNWQLRLFRRSVGAMNDVPVHAAPVVQGRVLELAAPFRHHGEPDIATRVAKINAYSSGLVAHKRRRRVPLLRLRMLLYPSFAFLRFYVGKRYCMNGWAGFIAARTHAFYAFLKYAKVYEDQQRGQRD